MKFEVLVDNEKEKQYYFHCPACEFIHCVRVRGEQPLWTVSGVEEDKPTVSPSILAYADNFRCHSFVREGRIQFLGDCTHKLAGQTVDLPDLDKVRVVEEQG